MRLPRHAVMVAVDRRQRMGESAVDAKEAAN
jgi:hypothetical protein